MKLIRITRTDRHNGSRLLALFAVVAALHFWFTRAPDFDASGTGRKPLVLVGGTTEQIQAADYVQSVGGVTTNSTPAGTGDIETSTETVSTTLTAAGATATTGAITISTWSTGQTLSDWNPAGLATASRINVQQSSGTTVINGIVAQPTGTEITIYNAEGSVGLVKLAYETGTSANQFVLPTGGFNWTIQGGGSIKIRYGGSNWQVVGTGTTEFPTITADNGATINGTLQVQQLRYQTQYDTTTGVQDPFVLFNSTTLLVWAGASDATFKGMYGNSDGHHVTVINTSSGHSLTFGNQDGTGGTLDYQNLGNVDLTLSGLGSWATFDYVTVPGCWQMTAFGSLNNAVPTSFSSTTNKGAITLSSGTGTATVNTGAVCTCTETTSSTNTFKCAVSGTTLTATGTGTDVIAYHCF